MVDIKIVGPGSTMSAEIHLITKVLKEAGYDVQLVDDYPCHDDEQLNRCLNLKHKSKVRIEVDHLPWGG